MIRDIEEKNNFNYFSIDLLIDLVYSFFVDDNK